MKSVAESTQKFNESIKFSSNIYKTSFISTKQNLRSNLDLLQEKQFYKDEKNNFSSRFFPWFFHKAFNITYYHHHVCIVYKFYRL